MGCLVEYDLFGDDSTTNMISLLRAISAGGSSLWGGIHLIPETVCSVIFRIKCFWHLWKVSEDHSGVISATKGGEYHLCQVEGKSTHRSDILWGRMHNERQMMEGKVSLLNLGISGAEMFPTLENFDFKNNFPKFRQDRAFSELGRISSSSFNFCLEMLLHISIFCDFANRTLKISNFINF